MHDTHLLFCSYNITYASRNILHLTRIEEVVEENDDKKNKKQRDFKCKRIPSFVTYRIRTKMEQIFIKFYSNLYGQIREFLFRFVLLLYIVVNDETTIAPTIISNGSTVDCDGESRYKCTDLATDDSSCDSNTQSSFTTFATTIEHSNRNCDSTKMR